MLPHHDEAAAAARHRYVETVLVVGFGHVAHEELASEGAARRIIALSPWAIGVMRPRDDEVSIVVHANARQVLAARRRRVHQELATHC